MRLPWRRELRRGGGIFHGGAIMALADHVAGCLFMADPRVAAAGHTGVTTDFHASFLRAAAPGEGLVAEGWVLRRGRNMTFMEINVRTEGAAVLLTRCVTTYLSIPATKAAGARKDPPEVRTPERSEGSDGRPGVRTPERSEGSDGKP
jgi:uncharacterized protein (TIGR00369 family)